MKLAKRKEKLHKKMRVKDTTPGALIRRANTLKTSKELPSPHTLRGLGIRGLI